MSLSKRLSRPAALTGLALVALAMTWIGYQPSFVQILEWKTVDWRFRLLGDVELASDEIVVVEIDEASIRFLESSVGRWPWPRDVYSEFLYYMQEAGAKLVVFDIQFHEQDRNNPEGDRLFAEATGEIGNVIHSVTPLTQQTDYTPPDRLLKAHSLPAQGRFPTYPGVNFPIEGLAENALALGHIRMALDPDGPVRRHSLLTEFEGRLIPSLSLVTALAIQDLSAAAIMVGEREVIAGGIRAPLDLNWRLPIWFNGGPGTYSPAWKSGETEMRGYQFRDVLYSYVQILNQQSPILDPVMFQDKIVIVGVSAEGLHDLFTTPYSGIGTEDASGLGKMIGAEIHANMIDNLINNRYLIPTPGWANWLMVLGLATLVLFLLFYTRLRIAGLLSFVVLAGYLCVTQLLFADHHQLPVVPMVLCWTLAQGIGLSYQYWSEGTEKRKVKQTFSHFVPKDVYQHLLADPSAAELGGRRRLVTVLFSDLRGFTSMSENRQPEEIVEQLNQYFSAMVTIVFDHHGTIDKFVGDMIMALFNTPLPDEDHADHAVQCAIAMHRKLLEMNKHWVASGSPPLRQGIGINSGEMVAGIVGAETIRSYTVIGDNVNLGARLESLCKEYKADIIISEFTRRLLKENYPGQELGEVRVKGKSRAVKIFRLFYEPEADGRPPQEGIGTLRNQTDR